MQPEGPIGLGPGLGEAREGLVAQVEFGRLRHGLPGEGLVAKRKLAGPRPERHAEAHAEAEHVRELRPLGVIGRESKVRVERAPGGFVGRLRRPDLRAGRSQRGAPLRGLRHQRLHAGQRLAGVRQLQSRDAVLRSTAQKRVQSRGHRQTRLLRRRDFFRHRGDRDLGLQDIVLEARSHRVQRIRDVEELAQEITRGSHDAERPVPEREFVVGRLQAEDELGLHLARRQAGGVREVRFAPLRGTEFPRPGERLLDLEGVRGHSLVRSKAIQRPVSEAERNHRIREDSGLRDPGVRGLRPQAEGPQHRVPLPRERNRVREAQGVGFLQGGHRRWRHTDPGRQRHAREPRDGTQPRRTRSGEMNG